MSCRFAKYALVSLVFALAAGRVSAYQYRPPGQKTAPKERVNIRIAEAEGLVDSWEEKAADGAHTFRSVRAGARGEVPIEPWWGTGLRPKEDASYLAEISYKDTSDRPILVEMWAGLPGRYELHRIGGLADGEWKTAKVPVPWDMVMKNPESGKTSMYILAGPNAPLPVESIVISDGDPEKDEKLWAEETRDWVNRVQEAKRRSPNRKHAAEKAQLAGPLAQAPMVPFARSTADLVCDNSAPKQDETGVPVRIRMATNEIEPGQFGVYANGTDLKGVSIELDKSGLKSRRRRSFKGTVELFTAEYSVTSGNDYFPQRLWPAYPVDIPSGRSHLFWINVEAQAGSTMPDTYSGRIAVRAQNAPTVYIPVEVTVLPIKLLTMKEAGLQIGGCTTGLIPAHELKELNRHNMNSINLWYYGFAPKLIRKSSTDFDMDFTIQDDFMKWARKYGTESFVYFLGGNPYGFPDTDQLSRELYRCVYRDGSDMMGHRLELLRAVCASPNQLNPDVRPLYVKWAREFMKHAREKNWPEPLLTPFDEPAKWVQGNWARAKVFYYKRADGRDSVDRVIQRDEAKFMADLKAQDITPEFLGMGGADTWIKSYFKDACAAIHEGWPKARIYGSIHHAEPGDDFIPDIEVFCTNAIHENPRLGDLVRAEAGRRPDDGVVFWQYSGGGDSRSVSEGRYTFGFFFGAFDSRGSLCWAYNWGGRFDTSSGDNWLYGWTTPYSVVRAPFWEGMREAWDDRRYIETLRLVARQKGKDAEAEQLLNSIFDTAVRTRTAGGRDTVNDFYARTNDPQALDTMRGMIADLIMQLASPR
ncbi:MAG: hypothetical protein JW909_06150 [Planctomycetes bacterium]|nr:hypothetical protein [Planctomycetota bacterium]